MALDAALTVALVTTGLHFWGPDEWVSHENFMRRHPGIIPTPVDNFLDHVSHENETTFWIGNSPGSLYTLKANVHGIVAVTYFARKSKAPEKAIPTVMVTTYENRLIYSQNSHRLLAIDSVKTTLANDGIAQIDTNALNNAVVSFSNRPTIVTLEYPKAESLNQMKADAANLRLLK